MEYLIQHAVEFLLICVGIGIILFCASKFIPHPLKLIGEIVYTLIHEISRSESRMSAEKINFLMIIGYIMLTLLASLFELGPSAFRQALGFDSSGETTHRYSIACLCAMTISTFVSPTWILIMKREERLGRKAAEVCDKELTVTSIDN